jgi:hypothetical protein
MQQQEQSTQLSAEAKHQILLQYQPHSPTHNFSALALRNNIHSGWKTIQRWYKKWDGTPHSLEHRKGAGRPRILSRQDVNRYIRAPILAANRKPKAIHYTSLLPLVEQKTQQKLSIRTLRNYGEKDLHVKDKHTIKRTQDESKSIQYSIYQHLSFSFFVVLINHRSF